MVKKFSDHELVMLRGTVDLAFDKIDDVSDQEAKEVIMEILINDLRAAGMSTLGIIQITSDVEKRRRRVRASLRKGGS